MDKWNFVRYTSMTDTRAALVMVGNKNLTVLMIREFPVRIYKVPMTEKKYCDYMGDLKEGVAAFNRLAKRVPLTKGALAFLKAANTFSERPVKEVKAKPKKQLKKKARAKKA